MAGWWAEIAQVVAPTTAALVITGGTPTVTIDQNRLVVPTAAALTLTGGTPTVTATDHKTVTPTAATLSLTGDTPTVSVGVTVAPTGAALSVTGGTPTVTATDHKIITPTGASLTVTGGTPSLGLTLRPTGATLTVTGGTPTVTVASSHPTIVGSPSANAGDTVPIPAHQIGDIIVLYAYRGSSTVLPSKPAASAPVPAWVDIDAVAGANTNSSRTAYFVAVATNTTSGVWANADDMIAVVLRGQNASPIGAHAESGSNTANGGVAPAVTMSNTSGSSVLLHFVGRRNAGDWTAWSAAPAGYTRQATIGAGAGGVILNTKDVTTSDGAMTNATNGSITIGYRGATIEILA